MPVDLNTLFQNGMGSFASVQAGSQLAQDEQAQAQKAEMQKQLMQEQVLKNQQTAAMNPLDQMFRQGQVQQQQAQLPGIQAQSDMAGSQARVQQGQEASQIAATIAKNQDQIGEYGMKEMKRAGEIARQSAAILRTVPVMQRPAALQEIIQQYGANGNSRFMQSFLKMDPNKMPDMIDQTGQGMAMASDNYITEIAKQKSVNETHIQTAKIGAGATLGAAQISANSRLEAAKAAGEARMKVASAKMSTDQKLATLTSIPSDQMTQDDIRQINELREQRIRENQARTPTLPYDMTGKPAPMAQPVQPYGSGVPAQQPQPTPQAAAAPPGMKLVGTSQGHPVYEDASGKRFIGN